MESIADLARIGEDNSASLEDLRQTLGKVIVCQVNGNGLWLLSRNSSQKLIAKLDFQIHTFDPDAMAQNCGKAPK